MGRKNDSDAYMWVSYRAKALNLGTDLERVCSGIRETKVDHFP